MEDSPHAAGGGRESVLQEGWQGSELAMLQASNSRQESFLQKVKEAAVQCCLP